MEMVGCRLVCRRGEGSPSLIPFKAVGPHTSIQQGVTVARATSAALVLSVISLPSM